MTTDYEKHRKVALDLLDTGDDLGGIETLDQALAAAQVHATLALAAAAREVNSGPAKVPAYRHHLEPNIDGGWLSMPMLGSATARVQVGTLTGRHNEGVFLTAAKPTENLEVQMSFKDAAKLVEQIQQIARFHKGGVR